MERISANSLSVYLSAVRQLHLQHGFLPPAVGNMPRLQQVLRGIRISQARSPNQSFLQKDRLPITPILLRNIRLSWSGHQLDQDKVMLWAAFTTCFFGFMRSGELCIQNTAKGFDETTDLTFNDVAVNDYQYPSFLRIHLKTSKTDPFGRGSYIVLGKTGDELCPVVALLQWLVLRGNSPGPLFRFASGAPLTRSQLVSKLRYFITQMGDDASGFSGHSFRSGAATTAAHLNIPDSQIKLMGRWKSNAFQRYVKPSLTHLAGLRSSLSSGATSLASSTVLPLNSRHDSTSTGQPSGRL